ncbi:uncharacterized protein LOC105847281 isoform X1 [Hydra vulgaris]|uniref:uncharacterized protein LOC105847281 isoform X1 n=1 Tax=Hydra vulgaris TaxID=6087 RepID=UPI001F5FF497|nr:uncharacterized protein LOC105847281 [Hydra vulgaris]
MMLLLLKTVLSCFILTVHSQIISYTPPTEAELTLNSSSKPLGYSIGKLVNPPNIGGNFGIKISNLSNNYLDVKVETVTNGITICIKTNLITGESSCAKDKYFNCFISQSSSISIEFYCSESCSTQPVEIFYYRVVKSPDGALDTWCSDRQTDLEYPSDLLFVSFNTRIPKTSIKNTPSKSFSLSPPIFISILLLFVTFII